MLMPNFLFNSLSVISRITVELVHKKISVFICIEALNNLKTHQLTCAELIHPQQPNMHSKICSPGTFTNRIFQVVKQSIKIEKIKIYEVFSPD